MGCREAADVLLSIVMPAYDEAKSLPALHAEIVAACKGIVGPSSHQGFEIIVVDDGSTDATPEVCASLEPLRYFRHRCNLGQTAALNTGFDVARGEFVVTLDADGQNDPADIPRMLAILLDEGLDCVCGWRKARQDPLGKRIASRGAYMLRQLVLHDGVHDSGCTLKVFRRSCLEGLVLERDEHRFIPALLKARGFKVGEVVVNHRPRVHGSSKYGPSRMLGGLRDLLRIRRGLVRGDEA